MYTHMQSHMHTLVQQTCYYSSSVIATDSYKRRQTGLVSRASPLSHGGGLARETKTGCDVQVQFYQRSQLSRILRESHAFHLQVTLSRIAACFSRNQETFRLLL